MTYCYNIKSKKVRVLFWGSLRIPF